MRQYIDTAAAVLLAGVIATSSFFLLQYVYRGSVTVQAAHDPLVRAAVVRRLVRDSTGIYDSHVDPDVGRINLPGLSGRLAGGVAIVTNRFGIREREYQVPKPKETVRVVILGDSYVFGWGVESEDRLGVHLERWLNVRQSGSAQPVEVLHFGVPSWNFTNQTEFLRRQLSVLQPDLVLQISAPNDIGDGPGARGFGEPSLFTPQHRTRGDSIINAAFPMQFLDFDKPGYLRFGIDYEGRARYQQAYRRLRRLQRLVEDQGGRYRLLLYHGNQNTVSWLRLGSRFPSESVAYIARTFANDSRYWNSVTDRHWNPEGHMKMAELLYGLIERDKLLPTLQLARSESALATVRLLEDTGVAKAVQTNLQEQQVLAEFGTFQIASQIVFSQLNQNTAAQIHGGIDRESLVSPYASMVIKSGGSCVVVRGETLGYPELEGTNVQVFADDQLLGAITLQAGAPIDSRFEIPPEIVDRQYYSLRFLAKDYVYAGSDFQHMIVFQLAEIALQPHCG